MAQYKSRYPELGFYVDGQRKKFRNGVYKTEDKQEIEVLDGLRDVDRVDEPKEVVIEEKKAEDAAPAQKAPKKASAK